jgi:hypothetical protein
MIESSVKDEVGTHGVAALHRARFHKRKSADKPRYEDWKPERRDFTLSRLLR